MTNFSTNQVMQFYALDGLKDVAVELKPYASENAAKLIFTKDGEKFVSDKIENVMWATYTAKDDTNLKVKSARIAFAEGAIPVVGEDYIVRVSYPEVGGLGIEGWTTKTVVAHAGKGATTTSILNEIKNRLTEALEVDEVLVVGDDSDAVTISSNTNVRYERGIRPIAVADFKVSVNTVVEDGVEVNWAALTEDGQIPLDVVTTDIVNGYKLADMEYFALGERGDEYRMMGYPDYIKSDYIVNPAESYNVLNVHFAYRGANDQSHLSEKDLILVSTGDKLDAVITALQTKFGIVVKGYTA